jgi:hypothetical protein
MTLSPTNETVHGSAAAVQRLYAGLLDDTEYAQSQPRLWDDAEAVWQEYPELMVTQGAIRGLFRQNDINFSFGSRPGYAISIDAQLPRTNDTLNLALGRGGPAFHIQPVPPGTDILRVRPVHPNHAEVPLPQAFNIPQIVANAKRLRGTTSPKPWFGISFRSQLAVAADNQLLLNYDRQTYESAAKSPELIYYRRGARNARRWAHSFCLWTDVSAARAVSSVPTHRAAMKLIDSMYDDHIVNRFVIHHDKVNITLEQIG